jgi:hypothetical protein
MDYLLSATLVWPTSSQPTPLLLASIRTPSWMDSSSDIVTQFSEYQRVFI